MQNVEVVVEKLIMESEVGLALTADGQMVSFMFSRLRNTGYAYRNSQGVHVIDPRIVPGVKLVVDIEPQDNARPRVTKIHDVVGITKISVRKGLNVDARGIGTLDWHSGRRYGFLRVTCLQTEDGLLPVESQVYKNLFVHLVDVHPKVRDYLGIAQVFSFIVIASKDGRVCGKITRTHP